MRKAVVDVVAQFIVAHQQFHLVIVGVAVNVVRALPAHDVFGAFNHNGFVALFSDFVAYFVAVNQRGVGKCRWCFAKQLFDFVGLQFGLNSKLVGIVHRCKRVRIWCSQKLYAARLGQFLERIDHFGSIAFELLQGQSRYGKRHFEFAVRTFNHLQQCTIGFQVAQVGVLTHSRFVGIVVVIVVVVANVEKTVAFQIRPLMYAKNKIDCFHSMMIFLYFTDY